MDYILYLLGMLVIFSAVLFIAWLTARLLGRKLSGASKNKLMRIVETLQLGLDRCLYLVKAGDQFFLFYATRKKMELVSKIEVDEKTLVNLEEAAGSNHAFDFKRIFDTYSGLGKKDKHPDTSGSYKDRQETHEQSPAGSLSRNINKLRKISRNGEQYKG